MAEAAGARRVCERRLEERARRESLQQVEVSLTGLVDAAEQAVDDAGHPIPGVLIDRMEPHAFHPDWNYTLLVD